MSTQNHTQITWTQIAKTILAKSEDDYQTKVKPTLRSGQDKLGTLIETLRQRIKPDTK